MIYLVISKSLRTILTLIFLFTSVLLLTGCESYANDYEQISKDEKIIIRFSHVVGEDTPKGQAARKFSQLLKERTNGKIEVQVFANGSLYRDGEEWDALQDGKIQMIAPAMSKMSSKIPELEVFDLPFYFSNLDQVHQLTDGKVGDLIFRLAQGQHVQPLAVWDNGFKQFTNNRKPIQNPKDFKGLTFRIMPSLVLNEQYRLIGAKAEVRNFNDIYQSIINEEIDGQENTISNIYTKRFYEVQKYMTLSNHGYLGYIVIMNQKFWEGLSPEYQATIQDAMEEVTEWQRTKAKEIQERQLALIKESNSINIVSLTKKDVNAFRKIYLPLYKETEGKFSGEYLKEIQSLKND